MNNGRCKIPPGMKSRNPGRKNMALETPGERKIKG